MSLEAWTLVIAIITAVTCGLCGSLLVANRQAMVSEGISHAVLPGMVIAFMVFRRFDSPWLIIAAAASGLLMVILSRMLAETRLVDSDAGLGLVFASMFSFGILLVSLNLRNTHFHADCIIDGNLALAALDRIDLPFVGRVPKSLIIMSVTFAFLAAFIALAYKELKAMIFDPVHAAQIGLRPGWFGYIWIALVSLTTVTAFDIAGSVLIVALMIAPPASAFLLTRRYGTFLWLSMLVAAISAVGGFYVARELDVSPTGPIASTAGMLFVTTLILNPTSGLLANWIGSKRKRKQLRRLLAAEVVAGSGDTEEAIRRLADQLDYSSPTAKRLFEELVDRDWLAVTSLDERIELGHAGKLALKEDAVWSPRPEPRS